MILAIRWSLVPALTTALLLSGPVLANCFLCDTMVELDQQAANCFLERADEWAENAQNDSAKRTIVDLGPCLQTMPTDRRSIDAFPSVPDPQDNIDKERLRTSYLLELNSIQCVSERLASNPGPINPFLRIDLVADCD